MYVVDRGAVEFCRNETLFDVNWPASSPGLPILAECPKRYAGQSQRICELRDFGKPTWLMPNFSGCLADTLLDVYNEVSFESLTHTLPHTFTCNPQIFPFKRHKSEKADSLGTYFSSAAQLKFNENSL